MSQSLRPAVVPDVATMNKAHPTHFSYRPDPAIRHVLRGWNQSGLLPLIYAHLFSLELVREVFGRQVQQGKGPVAAPVPVLN